MSPLTPDFVKGLRYVTKDYKHMNTCVWSKSAWFGGQIKVLKTSVLKSNNWLYWLCTRMWGSVTNSSIQGYACIYSYQYNFACKAQGALCTVLTDLVYSSGDKTLKLPDYKEDIQNFHTTCTYVSTLP